MTTTDLSNPILNSPYDPPEAYFEIGRQGPTGVVLARRRPSESFVPVPMSRKGWRRSDQVGALTLDFDVTGERREQNTLINDIRREVERWRANNWNGVTPYTASCWRIGRPGHRCGTTRCCSASGRRPKRRSVEAAWCSG